MGADRAVWKKISPTISPERRRCDTVIRFIVIILNLKRVYFLVLKKNPNPSRFKNFFSKFQKNLNCPNKKPTRGSVIWYTGKMMRILIGQYTKGDKVSGWRPKKEVMGCAAQAANDPFMAKTIMMIMIWILESMPHFCFSLFMCFIRS